MQIRDLAVVLDFKKSADRFCQLLEVQPSDANRWAEATLAALATLYACGHVLPDLGLPEGTADMPAMYDVTDDEWKQIFGLVQQALGEQASYWAYFDPMSQRIRLRSRSSAIWVMTCQTSTAT
jgi:hypothetical protein